MNVCLLTALVIAVVISVAACKVVRVLNLYNVSGDRNSTGSQIKGAPKSLPIARHRNTVVACDKKGVADIQLAVTVGVSERFQHGGGEAAGDVCFIGVHLIPVVVAAAGIVSLDALISAVLGNDSVGVQNEELNGKRSRLSYLRFSFFRLCRSFGLGLDGLGGVYGNLFAGRLILNFGYGDGDDCVIVSLCLAVDGQRREIIFADGVSLGDGKINGVLLVTDIIAEHIAIDIDRGILVLALDQPAKVVLGAFLVVYLAAVEDNLDILVVAGAVVVMVIVVIPPCGGSTGCNHAC